VIITSDGYISDNTNYAARRRVVEDNISLGSDGTNISLGAAVTASSEVGGHPAGDAADGSSHTRWQAGDKGNAWLRLDFGVPSGFNKVVIAGEKNINSASIQYSDDGSVYNSVTGLAESPAWTFSFDSVTARYVRFNMSVDGNKKAEVDELETYSASLLGQGKFVTSW
jgi:hypothetical protein